MKYKIRYTCMALFFCGLLGWDLSYEYQKPDPVALAAPHPVVHTVSIKHLMAPAYTPPPVASTTEATSTPPASATSTEPASGEASSTTPTSATSTPPNRFRRTPPRRTTGNGINL